MTLLLNIDVPDLASAESFYCAAFGLTILRRWSAEVVELEGWPARLFLLRKESGSQGAPGSARSYARHWTPVHFDVVVPDLAVAYARALASGASADQAPTAAAYGAIAMLADPFGNGFCLLKFSEVGYETLATGAAPSVEVAPEAGR